MTYKRDDFPDATIINSDAVAGVASLPDFCVQAVITSPPYWGLRDYGVSGQVGAEPIIDDYIEHLVTVFAETRRVLADDGVLWVNVGDGFTSGNRKTRPVDKHLPARGMNWRPPTPDGMKPKDLIGVPWMLAFALRADGWFLRTDIVWEKPNGNPESVTDRPTRTHEFIFMLTKSEKYAYDVEATKVPTKDRRGTRRLRSVWSVPTKPYRGAHFAVFPEALLTPMIQATTKPGDIVLDPFSGTGTTGIAANHHGRRFIGVELNPAFAELSVQRINEETGVTPELVQLSR